MTTIADITTCRRIVVHAIASIAWTLAFADASGGAEPASAARRAIVDPHVTTAGGSGCRDCGSGRCRLHGHCGPRHHPDCRDGECVPFCPVRPSTFGFYGTQWRRWPGQGVVPASAEDAVTPMPPAKSAVPGPDEESPLRPEDTGAGLEPPSDAGAEGRPGAPTEAAAPDADVVPAEPMPPKEPTSSADVVPAPESTTPAAPAPPKPPQRLPSLEDILGGEEQGAAPRGEPMPRDADGAAASPNESPAREVPPADAAPRGREDEGAKPDDADSGNPFEDDSASSTDEGVTLAGFRYPDAVGGSLTPGGMPWQLAPPKRQRAAGSPRGR